MKTFPLAFAAELAKKTGIAPVWILKLTTGGNDYYLSDDIFTVASWNGGVTTLPWVATWGEVREAITGGLGEIRVADLELSLLVDPDANPNMANLATETDLETSPASLYLWFRGLNATTDPPQELRRFYVDQVELPDETVVRLVLQDETIKLDSFIGTKIDLADYPEADPDDVGKLIPIPFGTVKKLPALAVDAGIMTNLPGTITALTAAFAISDAQGLVGGDVIQIDDEQILINSLTGDQLTVTRGHNATIADIHQRGAIVWQVKNQFVYVASSEPVDTLDKVFGRVGEAEVDISAIATCYTGKPGDELAGYEGQAAVALPGYVTFAQAVDIIATLSGNIYGGSDPSLIGAVELQGIYQLLGNIYGGSDPSLAGVIQLAGDIQDYGIKDAYHTHTNTTSSTQNQSANGIYPYAGSIEWNGTSTFYNVVFPPVAAGNTITSQWVTIYIKFAMQLNQLYIGGQLVDTSGMVYWAAPNGGSTFNGLQGYWSGTLGPMDTITIEIRHTRSGDWRLLHLDTRPTRIATTAPAAIQASLTGVTKPLADKGDLSAQNGTLNIAAGALANNGTLNLEGAPTAENGTLDIAVGALANNGTLDVGISGNSTANTLVGDSVLVNLTRTTSIQQIFDALLSPAGFPSVQIPTALPTGYALNGAITKYDTALNWLDSLAFQLRCWFKITNGQPRLILRPDTPSSVKTITIPKAENGKKVWSRHKVDRREIINKIHVLFDRDWTLSRSDSAYRGISKATDATSIAKYGDREQPDLFLFDFVTDQAMADSLRDFYLTRYATRRWVHEFDVFLDYAQLEFADAVTLAWDGNKIGEVSEARHSPGDINRIDTIGLVVVA